MSASRDTAPRKAAAPAEDPARVGTAGPRRADAPAGSRLGRLVAPAVVLAILFAAWELVVRVGWVDELLLPAPTQVARSLWEDRSLLAPDLWTTTFEVVLGLAASLVLGVALAVAMHLVPAVDRALRPLVIGSQAVPIPVVAPLFVLVLGFGLAPKILIIALICFFPIVVNVSDGLRKSDADARKLLRSLDASPWQRLRFLDGPSALPAGFTGLKIAAAVAVIGAVLAEWAGSESGLGHILVTANGQLETARAFAATALLIFEAIALYAFFAWLERRVVTWEPKA